MPLLLFVYSGNPGPDSPPFNYPQNRSGYLVFRLRYPSLELQDDCKKFNLKAVIYFKTNLVQASCKSCEQAFAGFKRLPRLFCPLQSPALCRSR